ncbi:hypothetical protein B6S44_10505 [Bosea sp. Tri-44]|uniref:glycosyltransferase n=1 Tax=Bosea sp. Tri-44 TaxID=1972137 RepID=UPI00100E6435|nr:glycosyltransferase [Bosea sp. Tri-44]RXT55527.1 hypothetical protein B6S44_10505 [Bosea sp. Tri-44]
MTSALRLAVVTPVFNGADYIVETARSVANQLRPGDRYVVVDDGSTDDTRARLVAADLPIDLVAQVNAGEAQAVNAGIARAACDIVGIVNADDPILPGLLDAVRTAFRDDPTLDAVYPDWLKIDAAGQQLARIAVRDYDYDVLLGQHFCFPGPGAFFRVGTLAGEPVRDARSSLISDYDFWLRFGLRGAKVRRLPFVLATWRLHAGGTTRRGQGPRLARQRIEVIERLLSRPDVPAHVRELGPQALSAAYYHAALVGLRAPDTPALRYALKSYLLKPRWAEPVVATQRRAVGHLAYAAMQPLSGWLHAFASPLLPARFGRQAVLDQTFGLDPSARKEEP